MGHLQETPTSWAESGLQKDVRLDDLNTSEVTPSPRTFQVWTALLRAEGRHGLYSCWFRGECVVHRSRTAELDLCRILADRGLTGVLRILDAKTGARRLVIADIEKAAGLSVEEGPRFVKIKARVPK